MAHSFTVNLTFIIMRYWLGYLKILKIQRRYDDMTEMILHLGDVKLFDGKINYGFLPSSHEEWKKLIRHFSEFNVRNSQKILSKGIRDRELSLENKSESLDLSTGNSLESHLRLISWNEMSHLMLCHMGTVETINILQECDLSADDSLPVNFFQTAIFSAFINRQQRNLTHNLLEKLDSYLWTKKSNCLMPQLQFATSKEKQSKNSPVKTQDTLSLISSLSGTSATSLRYIEDTECHWGVKTKLVRNCRCCNLPLTETVSHVEPGILVFDCSHCFHKVCLSNKECMLCQCKLYSEKSEETIQAIL